MADKTKIEWSDSTWNPIGGCTRVSEGCRNCYAEIMAARFSDPGQWGYWLARRVTLPDGRTDHRWTGKMVLHDHKLDQPLRWKKPRRIFVNSTSDLFHENVPDEWIDRVFAVMALCPQHTFQVLTKRPERMREYLAGDGDTTLRRLANALPPGSMPISKSEIIGRLHPDYSGAWRNPRTPWPLPNVWLGTSVENANVLGRLDHLRAALAAVRFVSFEPLIGAVGDVDLRGIHWAIVGGESGPGARPMHQDWARSLRDQCQAADVAFLFKQWGEWGHALHMAGVTGVSAALPRTGHWAHPHRHRIHGGPEDGQCFESLPQDHLMLRVGKARAGRLLDGREWNEFPEAAHG